MALHSPENFHATPPAGFDGQFHWDYLNGAFGNTIRPMDLDGVVERNGYFLVFETKDVGKNVDKGQQITLERLVETGRFEIVLIWGKREVVFMQTWTPQVPTERCPTCQRRRGRCTVSRSEIVAASNEDVYAYAADWFRRMNERPR